WCPGSMASENRQHSVPGTVGIGNHGRFDIDKPCQLRYVGRENPGRQAPRTRPGWLPEELDSKRVVDSPRGCGRITGSLPPGPMHELRRLYDLNPGEEPAHR